MVLIIYVDSFLFVFVTSIITRGIGINENDGVCEGGILLCMFDLRFFLHAPNIPRPDLLYDH